MKIKHRSGNKTDRERLAKQIIFMHVKDQKLPEMLEINLPPGAILEASKEVSPDVAEKLDKQTLLDLEDSCEQLHKEYIRKVKPPKVTKLPPVKKRDGERSALSD